MIELSRVKDKIDSALKQCDRNDSVTIVAATKSRSPQTVEMCIRNGIVKLAEICHREFGVPLRGANVER